MMRTRPRRQLVPPRRLAEIADLAEAVADEHCPRGAVDPAGIARAKRITTSFGPYGQAFDGMLEHRAGRFHIYGNTDRVGGPDVPRARFTLAHELAHYYIDEHRHALAAGRSPAHLSQCEYESPNLAEQEADRFAAALLMPRGRFGAAAKGAEAGLAGVIALARRFGTSITATAIRYASCDIRPCAVVKWTRRGVAWKHLSSATFRARLGATVEVPSALPDEAPTRRVLGGDDAGPEGFFTAGTTASVWFPGVSAGHDRDAIFVEQAVSLGRYGVLTFLYRPGI